MTLNHNCTFVIGSLDIGIKHDRTSLVWLGISLERKRIELLGHQTWRPKESKNGEVQIAEVEESIVNGAKQLGGVDTIYADNWQAIRSLQSLDDQGIRCREINYGSSIVAKRLAKDFVLAFKNGMIALYFDKVLENDLLSMEVKYNDHSRTYKLHADRDENGHADSGFALAQGIMMAQIWLEENEQADEEIETGFVPVWID